MTEIQEQITKQIESGKLLIRQIETGWLLTEALREDNAPSVAITYKDRIFRMIFKNKEELLMLYNAMNGTHYARPDDLSVTTLDNAIYLNMKNDVSFVLYDKLMLYEHQSTKNPNMPLRNLFYVSDIYSALTKDENLYSSSLIRIPAPRFVVFYNGLDHVPEKSTLKLSDMYKDTSGQISLELITQVFNVNLGYNKELMDNCETLHGYAIFVDLVRKYQKTEKSLKATVAKAIDECIANGILADFLRSNRAEVLKMSIYEYDEAKHIQLERKEAREEGRQTGLAEGQKKERQNSIKNLIEACQELNASMDDTIQRISQKYSLSESEAYDYVTQYWQS